MSVPHHAEYPLPAEPCAARLVWSEDFLEYDFGPQHPLKPERLRRGTDLLEKSGLWLPAENTLTPTMPTRQELELVHAPDYVDVVQMLDDGEIGDLGLVYRHGLGPGDNPAFPAIHRSSALIAGGTLQAARGIMAGDYLHAFNPAGGLHHAMRGRASGFCVYNDAAVAIAALLQEHDARVLYLDFDAHHGDGVQELFYDEPRVLTFSIHESGRYLFPGTGDVSEQGEGRGRGYAVNTPMLPFTQDDSWLATVYGLVPALAEMFKPTFLVSQHGCDGHAWDPLTHLGITTRAIGAQARLAHGLAHAYCEGRWIGLGGGGYDFRRVVPRMYSLVFSQMVNRPLPSEVPAAWRERWASNSPDPLPTEFVDPAIEFPPPPRAQAIQEANFETAERARQTLLPDNIRTAYPLERVER
jgi:acetoin utilization protein AcuC